MSLYIDLLKKVLTFLLWDEPPVLLEKTLPNKPLLKRLYNKILMLIAERGNRKIVRYREVKQIDREQGAIWPNYAHTMIGLNRLDILQKMIMEILKKEIPGHFIECGVWRGGACIFMRGLLKEHCIKDRIVYCADSFQGLPKPYMKEDKGDKHYKCDYLKVSIEEVKNNFKKYNLLDNQVIFIKGWFKDTLPNLNIEKLAILRIDGDMYSSTWEILNNLYPKLVNGGYCIIDDYKLKGAYFAVRDYILDNNIYVNIVPIDKYSAYWKKEI